MDTIKVKVIMTVIRTIEIDPSDYIDDYPELFDEEGQLRDEEDLIETYKVELDDDSDLQRDFVEEADYCDVSVVVEKVK